MKFYVKTYRVQGEVLVAACDEDIHGKIFEDGSIALNVKKEFYGSELLGEKELSSLLKEATIANLAGKNVVAHAIKMGIINPENVLEVKGVPHAQMAVLC